MAHAASATGKLLLFFTQFFLLITNLLLFKGLERCRTQLEEEVGRVTKIWRKSPRRAVVSRLKRCHRLTARLNIERWFRALYARQRRRGMGNLKRTTTNGLETHTTHDETQELCFFFFSYFFNRPTNTTRGHHYYYITPRLHEKCPMMVWLSFGPHSFFFLIHYINFL
jgi:hypothetical protein